ncbi:MAG: glycosyltransferase family 9 protein [Acidobacteria bacterium]|nr:MAG: glycosyltransferase family 9 protein [Acidobacteriota bacterium]
MSLRVDVLKAIDALVGPALCALLARRAARLDRRPAADPPRRILVIRPGGIGDAVLFIPMLRALRRRWPQARLELLVEARNAGVVAGTDLADEVLRYDRPLAGLRRVLSRSYDLVIDTEQYHRLSAVVACLTGAPRRIGFATNIRRRLLTTGVPYDQELYEVYSFLELAERATGEPAPFDPDSPFLVPDAASARFAEERLRPLADLPRVAIHPGASIPERRWPPERYGEVARMLAERGIGIVILGGPKDGPAAAVIARAVSDRPHINLSGQCTLPQAAAVVARVAVYLSADSGVLHLAYAVGTPTVHLFGPGVSSKWGPPGSRFRIIESGVPCSPCTRFGFTPPCCQGLRCMLDITPQRVFTAVMEQLETEGAIAGAAGADG